MKIGIIAEFNPLHTGHTHLIQEVKSQYPKASIYIIMSTYFTQRGEPSFIDPYQKVKLVLESGADFIFELPPFFSTQRADIFARGSIALCRTLQLDAIAFGVENIELFSGTKREKDTDIPSTSKPFLKRIETFNTQQAAVDSWQPSANNILGHFYIEAANELYPSLSFLPIQRVGAGFSDPTLNTQFASATAIRKAIQENQYGAIEQFLPYSTTYLHTHLSWDTLFPAFLQMLLTHQQLETIATIGQSGLANRLKKVGVETNFETYITKVKTRAYTRTSIQRAMLFTLLNITQEELDDFTTRAFTLPPRLLGFRKQKSTELKKIPHIHSLNAIIDKDYLDTYQKFQAIYHLYMQHDVNQHFPFIFDETMA